MARQRAHRRAVLPMGDMFAVGGCDCTCGPTCNFTFCVTGGAPLGGSAQPLSGATITIYTNSGMGTVVGSCTTGSGGSCIINVGSTGTYWEVITATGYNTWSGSVSVGSCGGTQTCVPIATPNQGGGTGGGPATGYYLAGCSYPEAQGSLTYSNPTLGISGSLTGSGSGNSTLWTSGCMGPDSGGNHLYFIVTFEPHGFGSLLIYNVEVQIFVNGCVTAVTTFYGTASGTCSPLHLVFTGINIYGTIPMGNCFID